MLCVASFSFAYIRFPCWYSLCVRWKQFHFALSFAHIHFFYFDSIELKWVTEFHYEILRFFFVVPLMDTRLLRLCMLSTLFRFEHATKLRFPIVDWTFFYQPNDVLHMRDTEHWMGKPEKTQGNGKCKKKKFVWKWPFHIKIEHSFHDVEHSNCEMKRKKIVWCYFLI